MVDDICQVQVQEGMMFGRRMSIVFQYQFAGQCKQESRFNTVSKSPSQGRPETKLETAPAVVYPILKSRLTPTSSTEQEDLGWCDETMGILFPYRSIGPRHARYSHQ